MARSFIRIGTRKSLLALWQANSVQQQLQHIYPALQCELVPITTQGDKILMTPLAKIGGKGLFLKELEQALLANNIDIAVHSMKDVPATPSWATAALAINVICPRAIPFDAFVSARYTDPRLMPAGSIIGTSSLRRQSQILHLNPKLSVKSVRGNVDSRLQKLSGGTFDALILAAAGLHRLARTQMMQLIFPPEVLLPAVGQGAIGIQSRIEDQSINALIAPLHHLPTALCLSAERAFSFRLGASCQTPIAGYAEIIKKKLWLRGLVATCDGRQIISGEKMSALTKEEAIATGDALAVQLLMQGADKILLHDYPT